MISSIHLINWRSHADSFLRFKNGTNLLIGIMGSGKSSVLDGISFALFGTFPALERRRLKLLDVVRMNESSAEVILEFTWNGSNYRVNRKITKKRENATTHAAVYKDGKLIDEGSEAVNTYIENLLGVDYDLFTRAIYSEQNNIDYFLSIDPRRRKEEIDRLLGLDRFETARATIITVINRLKENRMLLEQKFNRSYLDEMRLKKAELEEKAKSLRAMLDELNKKIVFESTMLKTKEEELRTMIKKKELHEKLSQEKIKIKALIEQLEKEIEGKEIDEEDVNKLKKESERLVRDKESTLTKLNDINQLMASISSQLGGIEARKRMAIAQNEEIEKNRKKIEEILGGRSEEQLNEELANKEKNLLALLSEKKKLENELIETSNLAQSITIEISKCPLCGASLSDEQIHAIRREKEQKIIEMKKTILELEKNIEENEKELRTLKVALRDINEIKARLEALKKEQADLSMLEKESTALAERSATLQQERTSVQSMLNELNKQSELVSLQIHEYERLMKKKSELIKAKNSIAAIINELQNIAFDEKMLEALRTECETMRLEHEKKVSEKKLNEKQLQSIFEMLSIVENEITKQTQLENEIKNLLKAEEELSVYKNALIETQLTLRNEMIDGINAAMAEIWAIFYPHKNYKELKLFVSEKDYELRVFNGEWKPLESIASGGERACAALTFRVALAIVLTPNLSWLMLDEPTHNLDKDAIELLSHALQYTVPEVVQQTFVITHEEALAGSEFAASYRLSRDKSRNSPTVVEQI